MPTTDMPELNQIAESLKSFGGNPQKAAPLASILGFKPEHSPVNLLAGSATPLVASFSQCDDSLGVQGLYRVGKVAVDLGSVGLFVAVLTTWGDRPSHRDRARSAVASALVEHAEERRFLFIMVPHAGCSEGELVVLRARHSSAGAGPRDTLSASIDLAAPKLQHRQALDQLAIPPGATLRQVSERWQRMFVLLDLLESFSRKNPSKKYYGLK